MAKKWVTNNNLKERQRFKIAKKNPSTDVVGIKLDGREFKFGQGNMFEVDDPGLAHAIHDTQGQGGTGDVIVIPTQVPPTPGQARTWTGIKLPWHTDDHKFGESSK